MFDAPHATLVDFEFLSTALIHSESELFSEVEHIVVARSSTKHMQTGQLPGKSGSRRVVANDNEVLPELVMASSEYTPQD